jgi:nicotinamidase-related amidase
VAGTTPYAWPYDTALSADRIVLLIAGAQRLWAGSTTGVAAAVEALIELSSAVRRAGGIVVAVRHVGVGPVPWRRPSLPAPSGHDAALAIPVAAADYVVDSVGLDGFYGSALDAHLLSLGRDLLLVCGLSLEGPVHSTLRSANDRGYECLLIADACSYDTAATRHASISSVEMSGGIFGAVGTTRAVIDVLTNWLDEEKR